MTENEKLIAQLKALLKEAKIQPTSKYLTAKGIEAEYGISHKTVLNRSNLPTTHKRYLPYVNLKGGRLKYFERRVIERLINIGSTNV